MTENVPFGDDASATIRFIKAQTGLSSRQLAEAIEVDASTVFTCLKGKAAPGLPSGFTARCEAAWHRYRREDARGTRLEGGTPRPVRRDGRPMAIDPQVVIDRRAKAPDAIFDFKSMKWIPV